MNTDSFYTKGALHRDNQDYSIHSQTGIIVCDGCSGAINSDVGARILALKANQYLHKDWAADAVSQVVISEAKTIANILNLDIDCLCATLVSVFWRNGLYNFLMVGDGAVAVKNKDGLTVWEYKFKSGAPFYLRYTLDLEKQNGWLTEFGDEYECIKYHWSPNGEFDKEKNAFALDKRRCFMRAFSEKSEFIAILSDGISSFVEHVRTPTGIDSIQVPTEKVLKELLAFKNFQGEFVQRRCNRAFKKFQKTNWSNLDDVSVAAIVGG